MKIRRHRIWLIWLCVAFLGPISPAQLNIISEQTFVVNETQIFTCEEKKYDIEVDLSQNKFFTLCMKQCKTAFFQFFRNSYDHERNKIKVHISDCPNTASVEKFSLEKIPNPSFLTFEPGHSKDVPAALFEEFINLETLNLAGNHIENLPRNIFKPLKKLKSLTLDNNALSSLDENIFQSLINLEELTLNGNKLDHLPNNVFSSLINLKDLSMDKNNMTTLKSGTFDSLRNLKYLSLTENDLSQVPPEPFVNNSNLIQINMCKAFHKQNFTLPLRFFANLKSLQCLHLEGNKLSFLPKELFQDTTNLEKLRLDRNKLSSLNGAVQNLINLTTLSISYNELEIVDKAEFQQLKDLKELNLSHNQLTSVNGFPVSGKNMSKNLKNDSLGRKHEQWSALKLSILDLDLSFNNITDLQTEDFTFFNHSRENMTINLSNNTITRIDLNLSELQQKAYVPGLPTHTFVINRNPINCTCEALHLAQYIRTAGNEINPAIVITATDALCHEPAELKGYSLQNVPLEMLKCSIKKNCPENCSCLFRSCNNTVEVNCTSRGISKFPEHLPIYESNKNGAFNANHKYELFFANNAITSMQGLNNLSEHFNITHLYLSSNQLKNIENLPNLKAVQILELHNNHLAYLSSQTIERLNSFSNLANITLDKNPWDCNCEAQYLLNFIQQQHSKIWNYKNIACEESGRFFVELTKDELCHTSLAIIITCASVAIIGLLTGAIITIYYKYKREIKVWIFAHPKLRWLVTEKEIDKDKLFDAFISFSHKDEDFVHKILRPKLEENKDYSYKVCVHDRDFTPGGFIPDEIVKCVENSRRTIIVLTSNFLHSHWCPFEFRTAYLQAIKERCARVIIIMLEDVSNHEKLDPDLKAYIKMHTYVQWGDPMFWRKLKYALPHPQQYKHDFPDLVSLHGTRLKETQMLFDIE